MNKKEDMNILSVVQHNDLLCSSYKLDIDEMRLINLALTKIDSRKTNIGKIEIYPHEFVELFDLNPNMIWRNMKKSVIGLMQKPIRMHFKDENGKEKVRVLSWLDEATYYSDQKDSSKIEIEFSRKIEEFLFELKGNFTKVNFESACKLTTPFSFRLYQWLARERHKKNNCYELTMTIEEIKVAAQLTNSYPVWSDFKRKVIEPAVAAINYRTNFSVNYKMNMRSGSAYSLSFTYIDEKAKLANGETVELSNHKPIRPALARSPKVVKGSHAEGEWMKKNLKILCQYRDDLKAWDSKSKIPMVDLRRLITYSKVFDQRTYSAAVRELKDRTQVSKMNTI